MKQSIVLTEEEYACCFEIFKKTSHEHEYSAAWFNQHLASILAPRKSLEILSVGSGTADFDKLIYESLKNRRTDPFLYSLIEPNSIHAAKIREKFKNTVGSNVDVYENDFFAFSSHKKFDCILFSHSIYYFKDRTRAISHAISLLEENGFLLIFHQTSLGISQIQRRFFERVHGHREFVFNFDDLLCTLDTFPELFYSTNVLHSSLDFSALFSPTAELNYEKAFRLVCFCLEANIKKSSVSIDEIMEFIGDISFVSKGKSWLYHPVGVCVVFKSGHAFSEILNMSGLKHENVNPLL